MALISEVTSKLKSGIDLVKNPPEEQRLHHALYIICPLFSIMIIVVVFAYCCPNCIMSRGSDRKRRLRSRDHDVDDASTVETALFSLGELKSLAQSPPDHSPLPALSNNFIHFHELYDEQL